LRLTDKEWKKFREEFSEGSLADILGSVFPTAASLCRELDRRSFLSKMMKEANVSKYSASRMWHAILLFADCPIRLVSISSELLMVDLSVDQWRRILDTFDEGKYRILLPMVEDPQNFQKLKKTLSEGGLENWKILLKAHKCTKAMAHRLFLRLKSEVVNQDEKEYSDLTSTVDLGDWNQKRWNQFVDRCPSEMKKFLFTKVAVAQTHARIGRGAWESTLIGLGMDVVEAAKSWSLIKYESASSPAMKKKFPTLQ